MAVLRDPRCLRPLLITEDLLLAQEMTAERASGGSAQADEGYPREADREEEDGERESPRPPPSECGDENSGHALA